MVAYHVTTPRKLARYQATGAILPPVRFWPDRVLAERWAKRTGRTLIAEFEVDESYPLPDHKPARWTPTIVSAFTITEVPR